MKFSYENYIKHLLRNGYVLSLRSIASRFSDMLAIGDEYAKVRKIVNERDNKKRFKYYPSFKPTDIVAIKEASSCEQTLEGE